jgi:gamma-tubulin complex component 2
MTDDNVPDPDVGEPSFMHETSFVRAPLNSRIDVGPSRMADPKRAKSKGKGREDALDGLPIDVQEALILDDLLYVLMVSILIPACDWLISNG